MRGRDTRRPLREAKSTDEICLAQQSCGIVVLISALKRQFRTAFPKAYNHQHPITTHHPSICPFSVTQSTSVFATQLLYGKLDKTPYIKKTPRWKTRHLFRFNLSYTLKFGYFTPSFPSNYSPHPIYRIVVKFLFFSLLVFPQPHLEKVKLKEVYSFTLV